jgi:hypothetical protein
MQLGGEFEGKKLTVSVHPSIPQGERSSPLVLRYRSMSTSRKPLRERNVLALGSKKDAEHRMPDPGKAKSGLSNCPVIYPASDIRRPASTTK